MKRKRLLEEFNAYMRAVYRGLPLGPAEWKDRQLAYYGGAAAALKILLRDLAPGDEPTEGDLESLRDLKEELLAHAKAVRPPVM